MFFEWDQEQVDERMVELATEYVPRCKPSDVLRIKQHPELEPISNEYVMLEEAMSDYDVWAAHFRHFAPPGKCVCCGQTLGGIMSMLGIGFVWGIVNGQGHCSCCHWPCTAYHRPRDAAGEEVGLIEMILCAHPDEVSRREPN